MFAAHKHVFVVAYAIEMKKSVPPDVSFESVCLPGHDVFCLEVTGDFNKLAKKLAIEFDHKGLVDDLYRLCGEDVYYAEGEHGSTMLWWRDRFERNTWVLRS